MRTYSDLPVYKASYDLLLLVYEFSNPLSRDYKYTIGSIFPENIKFDGKKCRTTRINDVLRDILLIDKDLEENKKGQISKKLSLSRLVESPRIELGSKQATKELSTRLVFI